ncbi:MAG: hypothetical protein IT368_06500 [Candidatus Hydrogenedentes bacterium]|nr:hypothetical protein [Candidatus Hydrogenedentota bacterium]
MRRLVSFALLSLIFIAAGCGEPAPPPEPENAPPPPPTAQELYQRLRQPLQPIFDAKATDFNIPRSELPGLVQAFDSARQQVAAEINAKEAMDRLKTDLSEVITWGKKEDKPKPALVAAKSFKLLEPGSTRYDAIIVWAELFLERPNPNIKGYVREGDVQHVFVEVWDPVTNVTKNLTVREGEEFFSRNPGDKPLLRVEKIVGEGNWVTFNYIPLNQTFDRASPSELRRDPHGENRPS